MRNFLKFFLLSLLAVLILWFFGKSLNWAEVWQSLRKAESSQLLIAASIVCFGYVLRAFRWRTLLAPITESNLRELFATTTVGFAAVFLLGRAGEVVRPLWLPMRDPRVRPSAAFVTIGVERICDLIAIVSVFALNLVWFKAPAGREAEFVVINRIGLLMLGAMVFGILLLVVFQQFSNPIVAKIETLLDKLPLPKRLRAMIVSLFKHLAASLQILRDPRELALTIGWTAALWLSVALPTWLVVRAFGMPLSFSDALFIMGAASLGSLVPTPGGAAGAFHAATAGAIMSLGIDKDEAAAVSIVLHLIYFAPALIFGLYYFIQGDINWSRFRSLLNASADDSAEEPAAKNEKLKIEEKDFRHSTAH